MATTVGDPSQPAGHGPAPPPPARAGATFWWLLGAITVAGVAVRVAYTLVVSADLPTIGDAQTYHLLAANLADGRGYIRPHDLVALPTAEFPPLFPAVLSVVDRLGGTSVQAQKLFTSVVGGTTVVLVGLLGRRVALGLDRWGPGAAPPGPIGPAGAVGLAAAGLAAAYPMLIGADGALMAESLYAPLVAAVLLATVVARAHPDLWRWALAGALCGLAALTRAEALVLAPLLLAPEALRWAGPALTRRLGAAALALVAAGLVVLPWTVRNLASVHRLVPVSGNSATLVAGANCDGTYDGDLVGLWRLDCITDLPAEAVPRDTGEGDTFAAYQEAGVSYAFDHLDQVPRVATIRALRTFGLYDPGGQLRWETLEGRDLGWQTAGHRAFLVMAPVAVAGAVVVGRRRGPLWPLVAPFALVVGMAVISYGNQRFRVAAEPSLLVLVAVAMVAAVTTINRSRRGAAPPGGPRDDTTVVAHG